MDISILSKNCLKIKGKQVTFVVDPSKDTPKTAADAVLLLKPDSDTNTLSITDTRIVISGPGEYEVGRTKISGAKTSDGIIYKLSVDGLDIILGASIDYSKLEGTFTTCQIVLLRVDNKLNEASITALEPKIAALYGDKRDEGAKTLSSQNQTNVSKLTLIKDKLPEKMEVIVLG